MRAIFSGGRHHCDGLRTGDRARPARGVSWRLSDRGAVPGRVPPMRVVPSPERGRVSFFWLLLLSTVVGALTSVSHMVISCFPAAPLLSCLHRPCLMGPEQVGISFLGVGLASNQSVERFAFATRCVVHQQTSCARRMSLGTLSPHVCPPSLKDEALS